MFDFDAGKLLIVGVIALIFIPPKDLPRVLRQAGQFVGRMRRMAAEFQGQFMDAMREADVADIRREAQKLADSARIDAGFDSVHDLDRQMVAKRSDGPGSPPGEAWAQVEAGPPHEVAPLPTASQAADVTHAHDTADPHRDNNRGNAPPRGESTSTPRQAV